MKEHVYIFGAGKLGKKAARCLEEDYIIEAFIDNDEKKWGQELDGISIVPPSILCNRELKTIIACGSKEEILYQLQEYHLKDIEIFEYEIKKMFDKSVDIEEELRNRTLNLGEFLLDGKAKFCKELTYFAGGSGTLDYFFIKEIAERFHFKKYLEIGTYIGESINILTDCMEELYSITAPLDAPFSMRSWCKNNRLPDYSERLTYSNKIKHYFTDSKKFDYCLLPGDIELFFIDGDHSYQGVYCDTKNIFKIRPNDSIVIWHDFKIQRNQFNVDVIWAVKDAIGDEFDNVYVLDNNLCGVYIPKKYRHFFKLRDKEDDRKLYVYDTTLEMHIM